MSETFHEYDFPHDRSVHWEVLRAELRKGALATACLFDITCRGCVEAASKRLREVAVETTRAVASMRFPISPRRGSR